MASTQQINDSTSLPKATTQVNMSEKSLQSPEVIQRLTFSSENIKRLTSDDFDISAKELITLKYDDCILILFYVENTESYQLADIWALVAKETAGPIFGAINMLSERKVAEAFTRLKSDGSNPLHWAALRQYPYILVYRKRWPVAVYNGPREVQALIDYSLTLACEAGYYEIMQIGGSMQAENRIEMGPYDPYTNIPGSPPRIRQTSLEYNSDEPIRGFNPNIPIVITGSTGAKQATSRIRSEEMAQQKAEAQGLSTSLTERIEQPPAIEQLTGESSKQPPSLPLPNPVATPAKPTTPTPPLPVTPTTQRIAVPANTSR